MKFAKRLMTLLLFFTGCTIPETLYITNNSDDVCIITIKWASSDRNLKEIKRDQPYLALSTSPKLQSIRKSDLPEFNKKLEYKILDNRFIEIHLPAKSSIYFPMSLARPSTIDSIYFRNKNKEVLFSRSTFRKSFEKPADKNTGYLYIFSD